MSKSESRINSVRLIISSAILIVLLVMAAMSRPGQGAASSAMSAMAARISVPKGDAAFR
jgi:hypothetical protein